LITNPASLVFDIEDLLTGVSHRVVEVSSGVGKRTGSRIPAIGCSVGRVLWAIARFADPPRWSGRVIGSVYGYRLRLLTGLVVVEFFTWRSVGFL